VYIESVDVTNLLTKYLSYSWKICHKQILLPLTFFL